MTGIAANLVGRRFVGVEREDAYLRISAARRIEMERLGEAWRRKIPDLRALQTFSRRGAENAEDGQGI